MYEGRRPCSVLSWQPMRLIGGNKAIDSFPKTAVGSEIMVGFIGETGY